MHSAVSNVFGTRRTDALLLSSAICHAPIMPYRNRVLFMHLGNRPFLCRRTTPRSCTTEAALQPCTEKTTPRSCIAEDTAETAPQSCTKKTHRRNRHRLCSAEPRTGPCTPAPLPDHAPQKQVGVFVYSETIDAKISDENKCESIMNYDLGWYNSQQEESWGAQAGTIRAQIMLRNAAAPRCGFACGCRLISVIPMRRREIP